MPSIVAVRSGLDKSNGGDQSTPQKRRLRSNFTVEIPVTVTSPIKRKSPRRGLNSSPNESTNVIEKDSIEGSKSAAKKLCDNFVEKSNWNPRDMQQVSAVKEALHVSTAPSTVVCREGELNRILEFCKACVEQGKAGSLYVSGCPGTGKSMSMEKVKQNLLDWSKQAGFQPPDMLTMNCTSLTKTSEIFNKIMGNNQTDRKTKGSTSPLQQIQNSFSQQHSSGKKMMLVIADELDYLITKDRFVLHDLFMLTTFPFSRCILIGIANAIDLADRFLPRLQSLNCKPMVITFRTYSKDQILQILQERLVTLSHKVFHPLALELCARKVAAASGDMRKALCVCRSAIEVLEAELRESSSDMNKCSAASDLSHQPTAPENNIVRIDHMAIALSKAFRSPVVDIIQSLPQHQQIILCSAVKFFRGGKKDTSVGELNKSYIDKCKSTMIPPVGTMEFLSMCRVLQDQGILKLGQSRDDKLRRVALKVDEADITFALQGVRFFRNCLQ